jgi:hypothetical protein
MYRRNFRQCEVEIVPYKEKGSCLDPALPGTGLWAEGVRGLARLTLGKRGSGNAAEMGKT